MKKENYQYSGYRGRATTTDKLRAVAMVLFVLVLLAVAALLIGQRYIVYTDDGIRVELPFLEQEEAKQPSEDLDNIEVVVEPAEPEEEPAPKEIVWRKTVTLPLEAVLDGTVAEKARQQGANAIVLDMKNEQGQLGYISQLPLAQQMEVNCSDPEINGKLGELSGGEFYLVARISCFRDHALAGDMACAIENNSGGQWSDLEGVRWSNPASPQVQDYLTGIMTELAWLGFDEILLDCWGYPTQQNGHLEDIKTGESYQVGELDQSVQTFLQTAGTTLADNGTLLAVQCGESLLSGDGLESGQSLKLAMENVQRIWLEKDTDFAAVQAQLEQEGAEKPLELLVPVAEELVPEQEGHQWLNGAEI